MRKSQIILMLAVGLAFGFGCTRPDWIEQTLVTVDVTGTWQSTEGWLKLALEQRGPRVTGSMTGPGFPGSRTLEGTVAGDVFRFKQTSGATRMLGEMTVNGDEMKGNMSGGMGGGGPWRREIILQRVNSSGPPRPQQQ